jgi:hypothetical protein
MRAAAVWTLLALGCGDDAPAIPDAPINPDAIGYSILDAYVQAWAEPDAAVRGRLLEHSTLETIHVHEPTRTLASRAMVDAAMAMFLSQYPGGTIPIVGNVREHNDRLWFRWDVLTASNMMIGTGFDFMKRAADDRLERVHSFFGTLPTTPGANTAVQQALLDAFDEPDPTARLALLETAVTDDVLVSFEGMAALVSGRTALSDAIGGFLAANPGRQSTLTTGYLTLPSAWHVAWRVTASDNTTVLGSGVEFALLAGDGRVAELVLFNGTTP